MPLALLNALHYLSIAVLFILLGLELWQLRRRLTPSRVQHLLITDIACNLSAYLVLLSAVGRLMASDISWQHALFNPLIQAQLGLFILFSLLSTLPTLMYFNWRKPLKTEEVSDVYSKQARWMSITLYLELLLVALIGLLALLITRAL